tara:strand:- start:1036 stop:1320 length:285 start_codon:yes stop_codon:yes gene_type:complete
VLKAIEEDCGQILPLGLAYELKLLSIGVLSKLKLLLTESVPDFNSLSGWRGLLRISRVGCAHEGRSESQELLQVWPHMLVVELHDFNQTLQSLC